MRGRWKERKKMREKKTLMSVALILQKWSEKEIKRKNESRPGCSAAFTNLHNYTT